MIIYGCDNIYAHTHIYYLEEEIMNSRKNRFISGLLSFVMMFTLVMQVLPPVTVHAADGGTGGLKISSPSDGATINGFETIKIKWDKHSDADHYWITVKDEETGDKLINEEYSGTTYRVYQDDYVFTEDGREYKIYVAAMDEGGNVLENGVAWHAIYVTNELELETPEITSHSYLDTHCVDDPLYVSWDAIDGADDYTVYVKKLDGEPDYNNDNESGTNITSFTWSDDCEIKLAASNLVAGKWYKIALCATNTDQGIDSEWTSVYILMEESSYLNVSEYPDDLAAEKGSTGSFWIESNLDWDITCDVSWVTWTINQVDDTHAEIIVKATSANTGTSDREAKFTISADGVDDEYVYVTQLAPEIELPIISNVSISDSVALGGDITWSASVDGNGSELETVTVGIFSQTLQDNIYFRHTNIGAETYTLIGSVTTGGVVSGTDESGNAKTLDMSYAGEYTVTIHAATDAAYNNYIATDPKTVTLTEPVGTGILCDVNSDESVNNLDRYILSRYLEGDNVSLDLVEADINRDGSIDNDDYVLLSKHLSRLSGYEDLYIFANTTQAKPVLTGIQDRYTVKKGECLDLNFSVSALSGGLIEKITLKHNLTGTTFAPISYTTNKSTYSNVFSISGYPLNTIGTYDFIVYCRASNYTITDNAIYRFTVDVIDSICTHPTEAINDIYKSTVYDSAVNSSNTHTYHHTYTRKCTNCGNSLGTVNSEYFTESHSINKKGYCLCGYIDSSGYSSWMAYNTSAGRTIVYRNPESTGYYGEIFADESVTVVGECCDRYLIMYSVSGGTKMGYVNKNTLYRTFTFNGNTIKLYDVIGTTRLYANISELVSQINGMYDCKSDDTATLTYYRTKSTDSALVINVNLSQADDWDGITFSVKGIDNQIIGYILTTKLNGEHYIDLNQFLEYASAASYNTEKAYNEAELLHMVLIRDYDEITFDEDAFDSDSVMKKILYKGGIGAIIDGVQNIMDLSEGEVVNGTDIMDTMVLGMISEDQDGLIDFAIDCTEALDDIKSVYDKINTAVNGGSPLIPQKFSYFLEELGAMSDKEFNSMLGSQIIGEASNNKELSAFLSRYGLSIENFPIDKVGNIRKAVKSLETLDTISKIVTPLLDGTNRYLTHKKISDNFKDDIKEQLLLLKNTATDQRVKNTIQAYINNIESGNYDSIFNMSEAWAAAGYTVEYLASNKDIIKNAYNFTYKLSQNGFFGSKVAAAASKMNSSKFMGVVRGVASADTLLSAPSAIMGIIGYDTSKLYDIEVNLVTVSSTLRDTRNQFSAATIGTKAYSDYFTACNLWVEELIDLLNDYCECCPDYVSADYKDEIEKYEIAHMSNRARMQALIKKCSNQLVSVRHY